MQSIPRSCHQWFVAQYLTKCQVYPAAAAASTRTVTISVSWYFW